MAKKPNTTPSERLHIVKINDLDWGTRLVVPSHLLADLDALLSQCSIMAYDYLSGGCHMLVAKTETAMFDCEVVAPHKCAIVPLEKADMSGDYKLWYNATYDLAGNANNRLIQSFDAWAADKVTE